MHFSPVSSALNHADANRSPFSACELVGSALADGIVPQPRACRRGTIPSAKEHPKKAKSIMPAATRQTLPELRELYRLAGAAIMRKLDGDARMQKTWVDGRPTAIVAEGFIKPN